MDTFALPLSVLRGMAVFMGLMTIAWSANAHPAAPLPLTLLAAALGIAIVMAAIVSRPRAASGPGLAAGPSPEAIAPQDPAGTPPGRAPAGSRLFGIAVGAELLAGVIAVVLLVRAGLFVFIAPVIALVVALHFLIFLIGQRTWIHLVAGLFGTIGAGTAIVLMAAGIAGPETGRAIAGLSLAACTIFYGVIFVAASHRAAVPAASEPR